MDYLYRSIINSQRFLIINHCHLLPFMLLFITVHDGDELPVVSQLDNFTYCIEQFV